MSEKIDSIEGFYTAYLTGAMGSSLAIVTFRNGLIVGADIGGGRYDGTYTLDSSSNLIHCAIDFVLLLGQQSITGATAANAPIKLRVPLVLPSVIDPKEVFRIDTIIGPINARFEKIRGF